MKSGLLAFGALIWAAPSLAQAADPLAPIAAKPATPPPGRPRPSLSLRPRPPSPQRPRPSPAPARATVQVPRDWRGVFDAIDAGNWASAQAGIAALPPRDPDSGRQSRALHRQGLAAGRPCLDPGAARRGARFAPGRPARPPRHRSRRDRNAADRARTAGREPRLASGTLSRPAGPGRTGRRPAPRRARSAGQGRRRPGRRSAAADLRAATFLRGPRRGRDPGRLRLLCARARHGCPARRRHLARRARSATGRRRPPGFPALPRGGWATANRPRAPSRRSPGPRSSASFAPAASIGPPAPSRRAAGPNRSSPSCARRRASAESFYGLIARETLGMDTRLPADPYVSARPGGRQSAQRQAGDRACRHRRGRAGRGNASPPGADLRAVRASCPDPGRQAARFARGAAVAGQHRAAGAR